MQQSTLEAGEVLERFDRSRGFKAAHATHQLTVTPAGHLYPDSVITTWEMCWARRSWTGSGSAGLLLVLRLSSTQQPPNENQSSTNIDFVFFCLVALKEF